MSINYKKFKFEKLDPISPTFCAAKWYTSDFYLHTGTTSSCHFPLPDKIDISLLESNINYINNTKEKILQRQEMLEGKQPSKCSNCWQVENKSSDAVSERLIYSYRLLEQNIDFTNINTDINQKPSQITVSFDTVCNFICSYCDASQSTSWATDLKTNGLYKTKYDQRKTYQRTGINDLSENYEYIFKKFVEYIEDSLPTLQQIICLGGEPLISPNFWNFINHITTKKVNEVTLTVVTNLSQIKNLQRLLNHRNKFKNIEITVSIDNVGPSAEFIRKGLDWKIFESNLKIVLEQHVDVRLIATIPFIALDKITDFLNWWLELNKQYSVKLQLFRLRHPSFQSIQILPEHLKLIYKSNLIVWLEKNLHLIDMNLQEQIKNIIIILSTNDLNYEGIPIALLQNDAKIFYKEFAMRHNFKLELIFDEQLSTWINS